MTSAALELRGVSTEIRTDVGCVRVVDDVSFAVKPGERIAIVGESGSGKSITALTAMSLLPPGARRVAGSVLVDGHDVTNLSDRAMQTIRGGHVGMVFQDALQALDPVTSIGSQIMAVLRRHNRGTDRRLARTRAIELLASVGFASPERFLSSYPHELSGGMRQRALIAAALAGDPDVLIADEPTTALDVTVQAQIVDLLTRLSIERDLGVVLISHDLGVVAGFAQHVIVMYAGRIVESGPVHEIYASPLHPYTNGLLECAPRTDELHRGMLPAIPGQPPNPAHLPTGCAFAPRCPRAATVCVEQRPALESRDRRIVACHRPIESTRSE